MENLNKPDSVQQQVIIVKTEKSVGIALLLTFLFGPLGLLYTSVAGGIILSVICLLLFWTGLVPIICWIISIIWAAVGTKK